MKYLINLWKSSRPNNGDTIVEVLICLAVLGLAIGTGYALTSRSFHSGLASAERNQAQALAQGQIEFIKSAYLGSSTNSAQATLLNQYKGAATGFCIADGRSSDSASASVKTSSSCGSINGSIYDLHITKNISGTAYTFNVTVTWPKTNGGTGNNQTTLYYKLP